MKTVSISVDEATWQAAAEAAKVQHTTLGALVADFLRQIAAQDRNNPDKERRARSRKELVKALADCKAVVGEKPTRDRTYSDRRFHRH